AADLRVASTAARFVLAFGRIGLVPDSGATWTLPRLVGATQAAELALVGDPVDAQTALRIGLVSRVVEPDELLPEARRLAEGLAAAAPRAVAATKHALERAWDVDLARALETEAELQGALGAGADHAEGLAAFREKRSPRFTGS
ncbi:MAG: enoyl-CoA hydratase/isomerase family protein, partial [Chloroflexota bacterium]